MRELPAWVLTDKYPAFYDMESGSAIEQTAKVYSAMSNLIKEYNEFVKDIELKVEAYRDGIINSEEEFKECMQKCLKNHIDTIDIMMGRQNKEIDEAIIFMKAELTKSVTDLLHQMETDGTLAPEIVTVLNEYTKTIADVDKKVDTNTASITALQNSQPSATYDGNTETLTFTNLEISEVNV